MKVTIVISTWGGVIDSKVSPMVLKGHISINRARKHAALVGEMFPGKNLTEFKPRRGEGPNFVATFSNQTEEPDTEFALAYYYASPSGR